MEQLLPAPSRSRECVFLKAPTVPSLGQARYAVSGPGSSLEPLMDVGDKSPASAPGAGAGAAPVRHVSHSSQNSPVGLKHALYRLLGTPPWGWMGVQPEKGLWQDRSCWFARAIRVPTRPLVPLWPLLGRVVSNVDTPSPALGELTSS